jgi:hypothetical protein
MIDELYEGGKKRRPSRRNRFLKSFAVNKGFSPDQIAARRLQEAELRLCATKAGFKLKKSLVAGVLAIEVFFDLYCGGKKICYLMNQWNSPLLRLGCCVTLRRDFKDLPERFRSIHHICSVDHVTMLFPPTDPKKPDFPISLETAVHLGNINASVLSEAVQRFAQCMETLRPLLRIK